MSEVVKVKRPVSIWLTQVMLALTAILLTAVIVNWQSRTRFSNGNDSLLVFGNLFILVVLGACIWGSAALISRYKIGKWVSLAALLGTGSIMIYAVAVSTSKNEDFWEDPLVSMFVLVFISMTFVAPYLILSVLLLFNPRVKMFFDPTLIPQVDESSAILHEPPPPPTFDK